VVVVALYSILTIGVWIELTLILQPGLCTPPKSLCNPAVSEWGGEDAHHDDMTLLVPRVPHQ
jgi:hypothetical protein